MKRIVMESGRAFEITKANWGSPAPAMKGEYRFERGAIVEVDDADAGALLDPKQRAWFGGRTFRLATAADEAPPATAAMPEPAGADPLASKAAPAPPDTAVRLAQGEHAAGLDSVGAQPGKPAAGPTKPRV